VNKLRLLFPPIPLQFQALHLSGKGEILPHIDNVDASGSTIMGVSLGAARVLRLEDGHGTVWDQTLEPGSCYIQRYVGYQNLSTSVTYPTLFSDSVRYRYKHSILKAGLSDGMQSLSGQRLSIMIRVSSFVSPFTQTHSRFQDMPNVTGA
jgi:alkylated DNA repair protein alkB homolog 7